MDTEFGEEVTPGGERAIFAPGGSTSAVQHHEVVIGGLLSDFNALPQCSDDCAVQRHNPATIGAPNGQRGEDQAMRLVWTTGCLTIRRYR